MAQVIDIREYARRLKTAPKVARKGTVVAVESAPSAGVPGAVGACAARATADPVLAAVLQGLKEIDRLHGALEHLLDAAESRRYSSNGRALAVVVRDVCADALELADDEE
jgi:hypothetical protein